MGPEGTAFASPGFTWGGGCDGMALGTATVVGREMAMGGGIRDPAAH